ncbi:MAG: hypothetical protein WAO71_11745 [Gallionella sp.]
MTADYITEQQEEEHRQAVFEDNMYEAAIHIIGGMGEKAAVSHVKDIQERREDAMANREIIEDENGSAVGYIDPKLKPASREGLNQKQIYAIQQKLLEKYC